MFDGSASIGTVEHVGDEQIDVYASGRGCCWHRAACAELMASPWLRDGDLHACRSQRDVF